MLKNYASLAKWEREGKRYFIEYTNMFFNNVHAEIVGTMGLPSYIFGFTEFFTLQSKGSERPSVSASPIKNSEQTGLSNQEMAWLVGSL